MISFQRLMEQMELDAAAAPPPDQSKSIEAVRAGINLREDFWDDFMNVIGNAEGMAELLDVSRDKIAGWAAQIQDVLGQISQMDDQSSTNGRSNMT